MTELVLRHLVFGKDYSVGGTGAVNTWILKFGKVYSVEKEQRVQSTDGFLSCRYFESRTF